MKSFIRDFQEQDTPQVIKIYQRAFAEPPWNEAWTAEDVQKDMDKCLAEKNPIFLVAEVGKAVVGMRWAYELRPEQFPFLLITEGEAMYGDELAIIKEFRGMGIATRMMRLSLERAYELGYRKFIGRTTAENAPMLALYDKLGYEDTGEREKISKKRTSGTVKTDERIYFCKDLEQMETLRGDGKYWMGYDSGEGGCYRNEGGY